MVIIPRYTFPYFKAQDSFFHVSSTKSQMAHNHCSRAVLLLEDAAICLLHLKRATEVSNLVLALVELPHPPSPAL